MSVIYTTYDVNFKQYLNENGQKYILCGLNPNSKDTFWVFERNSEFNILLNKWRTRNK